jgi:hypothetical protein
MGRGVASSPPRCPDAKTFKFDEAARLLVLSGGVVVLVFSSFSAVFQRGSLVPKFAAAVVGAVMVGLPLLIAH